MSRAVRQATRMLRKNAVVTSVAVCSLAIGIGANSAMFSLADALVLRPLPVLEPSRVVSIVSSSQTTQTENVSYPDYEDFRDRNRTFDGVVAYSLAPFALSRGKDQIPETRYGFFVSGNFFKVLGVQPTRGRGFRNDEDRVAKRDAVTVLSHDTWKSEFGADPGVIGQKIRLNGTEFTVIGVAPEHFTGMDQYFRPALYIPIAMSPSVGTANILEDRNNRWLNVKGRLKTGATEAQAQADVAAIAAALERGYPNTNRGQTARVETELRLRYEADPPDANLAAMLMALSGCVLLVACANVAGLLLSRSRARSREIAVRLAIGASRGRLIRQLLLESSLIALLGGAVGTAIAFAGTRFLGQVQVPTDLPIVISVHLDERVLLFTLLTSIVSTVLFGLTPAFRTTKADLVPALKAASADTGKRQRLWGRNLLVIGQIAVSLILLTVSGLIFRAFKHQMEQGPGFRTDHLLMMGFDPTAVRYNDAQTAQFYDRLLRQVRAMPGVRSAAWSYSVPLAPAQDGTHFVPEGYRLARGQDALVSLSNVVSDAYFQTMAIPIVRGRGFLATDGADAPRVAVVNQQFANHYWPNQDAIGKRFHMDNANGALVQVVGISATAKYLWIGEAPTDFLYLPDKQRHYSRMTLMVQSEANARSMMQPVRQAVTTLDRNVPIHDARTMQDFYQKRAIEVPTMIIQTVAGLGLMGLILAMIGLYGLVAYSVSRRTREIGVRMAIGAQSSDVLQMVLRQGLLLAAGGIVLGILGGVGASRMVMFLFNGTAPNYSIFLSMATVEVAVTLFATYIPARRASLVDPMRALRDE